MGFLWFGKKRDMVLKEEIKNSFAVVKQDIEKISAWINHLNSQDKKHDSKIEEIYEEIMKIKEEIDGIKSFIYSPENPLFMRLFKHQQTGVYKQTGVEGVQTPVQTGVQTPIFDYNVKSYDILIKRMSAAERALFWIILNSELKLSCDDLSALLGKDKATIRGQINSIKRKSEGLILEYIEKNGKKRYYINPKVKEKLLKKLKYSSKRKK